MGKRWKKLVRFSLDFWRGKIRCHQCRRWNWPRQWSSDFCTKRCAMEFIRRNGPGAWPEHAYQLSEIKE